MQTQDFVNRPPSIVVIGNFDGVHVGHQALLARAQALDPDLPLVVVTFWPHPMSVIRPGHEPDLITDRATRIELLRRAGAAEVRVVPFNDAVMNWEPSEFVDKVLVPLRPRYVCVGENFTFGRRATGTIETLRELADGRFQVEAVDLRQIHDVVVCSSKVRSSISSGRVDEATTHLGRPFAYRGVVVMGHQRGRTLGFPTANLLVEPGMVVPDDGVYAGWVTLDEEPDVPLPAAISVGRNPTFDDVVQTVVEAHVIDRTGLNLYGQTITVEFIERLRGNEKFGSIEALKAQMADDLVQARSVLELEGSWRG